MLCTQAHIAMTDPNFKAAFHDSAIPQMIVSQTGNILMVNHQLCQLLGQTAEFLCNAKCFQLIVEENPADIDEFGPASLSDQFDKEHLENWQIEKRFCRKDGTQLETVLNVTVIREGSAIKNLLIQLLDVTDKKRLECDLKRNFEELEQFAYIASHDLREPLLAIAGFATLLQKRHNEELNPSAQLFLQRIIEGTLRMEQKIDDLLAYSRASSNCPQTPFPLNTALEEAVNALSRSIESSGATVTVLSPLPIALGNRGLLAQVFQNLLSNSIKYCKAADPPIILISVEPYNNATQWLISVKDNGIGFDMQHEDRIFGVFQRLYTIEQYPGTGMGLAIVKKIVETHRGKIWTVSKPDQGASFFFTIPAVPNP